MIFVTVGTHEQPFNRLIKEIDKLVIEGDIKEKVIIQKGYSTYNPVCCETYKMMSYQQMQKYIRKAHIVITHGGPSSFLEVLQVGKVPIVVPRQEKFHEHINNHQVEFTQLITRRMNNIIPVYNISDLKNKIINYDNIINKKNNSESSNNIEFNKKFQKIVSDLF